jgi:hypothetical protein
MLEALRALESEDVEAAAGLVDLEVRLGFWAFWQQPDDVSEPPQHPAGAATDCEREAWRALQNKVLFGSVRHCAHVPGPETHGLGLGAGGAL